MRYQLTDHVIDVGARQLFDGDGPVHVEPQVFNVLLYLVEHRDRAVAKTELLDEVWGDQFVSESALTTRIKSARIALGDDGQKQASIRTVHGFGYQFVGDVSQRADTATAASSTHRLPRFHSVFRGRDDELRQLADLLAAHRAITIVGPGGMGKTRLSVELAGGDAAGGLPAVFVDLAPVLSGSGVPEATASSLNLQTGERSDPVESIVEFLAVRPHVIVLDNCEHVLDAAAEVASQIADRCPDTFVVATSREPLRTPSEVIFRLEPLELLDDSDVLTPDLVEDNAAAALFLDRARQVSPDLDLDARRARQVVELCRGLDGLPLALELAAGRLATFGLDDLVDLLERRLDVLGDRGAGRADRHRTLRATIEWSYDALDPDLQRLFRAISVLPGGVSIRGVDRLARELDLGVDGMDAIGQLVDVSLVVRTDASSGSRYRQLETVRAYGLDRLEHSGELERTLETAAAWILDFVASADAGLHTPEESLWVDRVRHEFPNVVAARQFFSRRGRVGELVAISSGLAEWARMREAPEIWEWADDLATRVADCSDRHRVLVLSFQTQASWRKGDIAAALATGNEAMEIASGDEVARVCAELAAAHLFAGELDLAIARWTQEGEIDNRSSAWGAAAIAASYAGRLDEARGLVERAHAAADQAGSGSAIAWSEYAHAEVDNTVGEAEVDRLRRAVESAREVDASFVEGVAMVTLASVYCAGGEVKLAAATYAELISHWLRLGSWTQQWTTIRNAAELLAPERLDVAAMAIEAAASDPSAPALDDEAHERLAALVDGASSAVATPSRAAVAEAVRVALLDIADAE